MYDCVVKHMCQISHNNSCHSSKHSSVLAFIMSLQVVAAVLIDVDCIHT